MLCSLMLEWRVGHIEKMLKCKEINYRTSDVVQDVTEKHIFSKISLGEDPHPLVLLEMFWMSYANIRLLLFKLD